MDHNREDTNLIDSPARRGASGCPPLYGGVLIGGRSSRMGRPKQLLEIAGGTLLHRTVDALRAVCSEVVLLGEGEAPADLRGMPRLADVGDAEGPLAGLLAAFRWQPAARWMVAGCDYPRIRAAALRWLLAQAQPGVWAVLPRRTADARPEPLLAYYEPVCAPLLEDMAKQRGGGPSRLARYPHVESPIVPPHLCDAWQDADYPSDIEVIRREP